MQLSKTRLLESSSETPAFTLPVLSATEDITSLLQAARHTPPQADYFSEHANNPDMKLPIEFVVEGKLPENRYIAAQESQFSPLAEYSTYRHDNCRRVAVSQHLRERLLQETHAGRSLLQS